MANDFSVYENFLRQAGENHSLYTFSYFFLYFFSSVIKIFSMGILCSCLCVCLNCTASYLKFCMFMNVFGPLSAEDEFSFVSHTNQVVLHGVTQKPEGRWESGHQYTAILCKIYSFINITAYKSFSLRRFEISQNREHHCI